MNILKRRITMPNTKKDYNLGVPVEKHDTAAWANIDKIKTHSKVTIPSDLQTNNAKIHVDENEK
jgi:hypothetical protein